MAAASAASAVAAALAAAIQADPNLPVSAAVNGGTPTKVDLSAKNKGKLGENPGAKPKIKGLGDALKVEAPGILNWMLDGYRIWRERGLMIPDRIRAATEGYRAEANPVAQFAQDCLIRKSGARVMATRMYEAYKIWCKDNATDDMTQTLFGRRLGDMGFNKFKSGGFSQYFDVDLADPIRQKLDGWGAQS